VRKLAKDQTASRPETREREREEVRRGGEKRKGGSGRVGEKLRRDGVGGDTGGDERKN
jgi:hypothetical protein